MLTAWVAGAKGLAVAPEATDAVLERALWVDVLDITPEEEHRLERAFALEVPTREEMQQFEVSHRLYREGDVLFLSATMLVRSETDLPQSAATTFILSPKRLITVRYGDPWSFRTAAQRCAADGTATGEDAFIGLLDATVERLGDMVERVSAELEGHTTVLFSARSERDLDVDAHMRGIGRLGNVLAKARESLVDKIRLMNYALQRGRDLLSTPAADRLHTLLVDAQSLSDQSAFIAGRIQFALDAALGMITMGQNRIIKIFSIAAVIFLPPTLVGTVYGMNFKHMPETGWVAGYPLALALMVLSVVVTLWVFRRKRWL